MKMDKEQLINFLKSHVIGKSLITDETVYKLEEGKLEGVYADEMFFSNLLLSNNGLQFDMATITREKVYFVDANNKRSSVKKDFTGVSVFRYELAERKSTSNITGIMRLVSSTVQDHTMEGISYGIFDVCLENGQLSWKEQQTLYRDMPTDKEHYRAVAFDAKIRFYLENEKLRFEYIPSYYSFDPYKLTKILSKDQYPSFLTKER
jgi:hypothetical protein